MPIERSDFRVSHFKSLLVRMIYNILNAVSRKCRLKMMHGIHRTQEDLQISKSFFIKLDTILVRIMAQRVRHLLADEFYLIVIHCFVHTFFLLQ